MTRSDLDLPLLPSAEQIRRKEFATVRRGYDLDQVREYLIQVAAQVETLERDLSEVKMAAAQQATVAPAEEPLEAEEAQQVLEGTGGAAIDDPYERLTVRFAELIRTTDEEASKILDDARGQAETLVEEARTQADSIRLDAQAHAEQERHDSSEMLANAKAEADRVLGRLSERRESLVVEMQDMQSRLLAVAQDLEGAIEERDAKAEPAADTGGDDADDGGATIDPSYEDLWVSGESVDLPDLTGMELDFERDDSSD